MFESIFGSLIASLIVRMYDKIQRELSGQLKGDENILRRAELERDLHLIKKTLEDEKQDLELEGIVKALSGPLDKIMAVSHIKGILERSAGMLENGDSLLVKDMHEIRYLLGQSSARESISKVLKPLETLVGVKQKGMRNSIKDINDTISTIANHFKIMDITPDSNLIIALLNDCHKLEYELKQFLDSLTKNV